MQFVVAVLLSTTALANPATSEEIVFDEQERRRILSLSPLPEPPADPSNHFSDDPRAADFGRKLFFDVRLSLNKDSSCATCHQAEHGWTDGRALANEEQDFPRNVPTLWNTAFNRWFHWDGQADSAWSQALLPIESPSELGLDRLRLVRRVVSTPDLLADYESVFGPPELDVEALRPFAPAARPVAEDSENSLNKAWQKIPQPTQFEINRIFSNLGKALAAFERTLVSPTTRFDLFVETLRAGEPSQDLTSPEIRGLKIFIGRGNCAFCHSGTNLSDGEFHDLGIAVNLHHRVDPGRYGTVNSLLVGSFNQIGPFSDRKDPGAPVRFLKLQGSQLAQFKTPTLRQLVQTAPYMHDGRFATLRDVVMFYSQRQGARPLEHASNLVQPLELTPGEVEDLVSFLETLSSKP
jgi:cytochrome c peroxidase